MLNHQALHPFFEALLQQSAHHTQEIPEITTKPNKRCHVQLVLNLQRALEMSDEMMTGALWLCMRAAGNLKIAKKCVYR